MFVCPQCGAAYSETGFCGTDGTKLNPVGDDRVLGTTIGAYRIAALIGMGGWGRVYLGVQPEIGSRVAIKVLRHDPTGNPTMVNRFFNEARAVNLIRHENIVNVIDLAQLPDGRMYITMEYLDGLPLSKHIVNHGQLGISETCRICSEVLDALNAAHGKGIIHRDLKPDNLFITPEGRAKVLDFGIAKLRDHEDGSHTSDGSLMGTPHFMSPEQAKAQPVDPRSDLYSIGVILYNCLTGSVPFQAASALDLARAHVEQAPTPVRAKRPDVPPELEALVLRALEKDPKDRWQSADAMGTALKRIGHANPGQKTRALSAQPAPMPLEATIQNDPSTTSATPQYPSSAPSSGAEPAPSRKLWLVALVLLLACGLGAVAVLGSSDTAASDKSDTASAATLENATPIDLSAPLKGVIDKEPQHYRLEATAGQQITFIIQAGGAGTSQAVQISLMTAGGQQIDLQKAEGADTAKPGQVYSFTPAKAQSVIVIITNASEAPAPFEMTTLQAAPERTDAPEQPTELVPPRVEEVTAEKVDMAATISGIVATEQIRHYEFIASPGQTTRLRISTQMMQPGVYTAKSRVKVTHEDGTLLKEETIATFSDIAEEKFDETILEFVSVEPRATRITIESMSTETALNYKIAPARVGPSTTLTGGLTAETAEKVDFATGVTGVVDKNKQTRYYRFDCLAGQSYTLTIEAEMMQPSTYTASVALVVKAETKTPLAKLNVTTFKDVTEDDPHKQSILFASIEEQTVWVEVIAEKNSTPLRYEIKSTKVGPSFPLSGGHTPQTAESVDLADDIEGVIDVDKVRYYRYEAKSAQTTTFTAYAEQMKPEEYSATLRFTGLAEDGEKLGGGKLGTFAHITTPELAKGSFSIVSEKPGFVLFSVHNDSDTSPVHYKIKSEVRVAQ